MNSVVILLSLAVFVSVAVASKNDWLIGFEGIAKIADQTHFYFRHR